MRKLKPYSLETSYQVAFGVEHLPNKELATVYNRFYVNHQPCMQVSPLRSTGFPKPWRTIHLFPMNGPIKR